MFELVNQLGDVSPWIILGLGVTLIAIDTIGTNDTYLAWIGVSVLGVGLVNAFGGSGLMQVSTFPVFLFVSLYYARRLLHHPGPNQMQIPQIDDLVGRCGRVLDVNSERPSEGRAVILEAGEWRVRSIDGSPLNPNDEITVHRADGLVLVVVSSST